MMDETHDLTRDAATAGGSAAGATRSQERLEDAPRQWRSLEDLAGSPEVRELVEREFPEQASEWDDPKGRRQFLQLMGASLALAGLARCSEPLGEKIVPFVRQPEDYLPGKPLRYATAIRLGHTTHPVLVTSTLGRPSKIEGNPEHPESLGATNVFTQASLLTLYDPDRSKTVTNLGGIRPYSDLLGVIHEAAQAQRAAGGAGLRFLTAAVTSPTLAAQIQDLLRAFPQARWHRHEPVDDDHALDGARRAFGQPVEARLHLDQADVILALDADFLGAGPGQVRHAKEFAARRRVTAEAADLKDAPVTMNRLYVAESMPTITGSMADHRLRVRASDVATLARAVAAGLGIAGVARPADIPRLAEADLAATLGVPGANRPASVPGVSEAQLAGLIQDLRKHGARSVVVAGPAQPPDVHALVHAMNQALGSAGSAVTYHPPADEAAVSAASFADLATDMGAGRVQMLVILGGNPVFTSPIDIAFGERLAKVGLTIHLGLHDDETAARCQWHVNEAHDLESWSDVRCPDGSVTILQPLIEPLYHGKTAHELLAAFTDRPLRTSAEIVKEYWSTRMPGGDFDKRWRRALHDGVVEGSGRPALPVSLRGGLGAQTPDAAASSAGELELVFRPDASVYDGRFANNGWLQELPRPITKLTWDNAAILSPATARRLHLQSEDMAQLNVGGRRLRVAVWVLPGHADDSVTLHLGYGRDRVGRVGRHAGFNAYAVRSAAARWIASAVRLEPTGGRYPLSVTQEHGSMEGRPLVRHATLTHFREHPDFAREMEETPPADLTMTPPVTYEGHAWAMAIDLAACTGCNACTIACQAENNIPIVGKEQVKVNREMHWIRVDRYFEGAMDAPEIYHQPIPCMQCENAPCEQVCPVAATVHSSEGLNDMVYNRCVGTRYCANNCPYKVRRFNFLQYNDFTSPTARLLFNPNVTVRTRGVMEKCTYCVQRINAARNVAEVESRAIRDGEIQTACQQVCPSDAIVFGDLNDPSSRVAKAKAQPRNYGLLSSLNTRPRTTYLAALKNPNPDLKDQA